MFTTKGLAADSQPTAKTGTYGDCRRIELNPAEPPPRGIEPLCDNAQVTQPQGLTDDAESDLAPDLAPCAQNDPELRTVVNAWPELPETLKAGIVAMVTAAAKGKP